MNKKIKTKHVIRLTEATRQQLISKSRTSDNYKDMSKGRNRWERRTRSHISSTTLDYNKIDMDALWKEDMLEFGVKVTGETNTYMVTILFENILDEFKKQIKQNHNKLEFKCILQALIHVFNSDNVYVSCTCPDWLYSGNAHWAYKGNYSSDKPTPIVVANGKGLRNPNDTKGAGCKHINLILANLDWLMKLASVINNYIYYCKDNMEYNYGKFIFPKLYGMAYDKAIQMSLFDYDSNGNPINSPSLTSNPDIINLSNALGRRRTQFKKPPEQSVNPRFKKEPEDKQTDNNALDLKFGSEEQPKQKELKI